jgi:RecJ-like exonuclease
MKKPHKCPVCDGTGQISKPVIIPENEEWEGACQGIYSCSACQGTGIVWEYIDDNAIYYTLNKIQKIPLIKTSTGERYDTEA